MSKLFEIKNQLDSLLSMLEVDPETGEIVAENPEMVFTQIEMLSAEKEEIIEYLVRKFKDTGFLAKSVDDQIADLKKQKERLQRKQDSLLRVIDRECNGEKKDYGFATVNYRKSKTTIIDDETACYGFLHTYYPDCIKTETKTSIRKDELKKLIDKESVIVPGARIDIKNNCSIR